MIVAGFGFRSGATLAALQDALHKAGGAEGVTHLATLATKAQGLEALGRSLDLPVVAIGAELLRGVPTPTRSDRVAALFGTGSIAEAAALAAAGPGARLRGPRAVSADGTATAAIAEGLG
ncbi:MAG: cobalamin biosynthesis protein [Tabrizicola sp.]|uniref:cobalamin biosynthesis protein n=1 Tax=Tabrizicola sp. TaxID=2005166 RepID=UPI002ABB4A8A|nr:cobalamin biosynthesis protein [Tabrizicola sp.]MDZ4087626.1 cobalamin biosynthesis protein [Tabrizicola sp.]